MLLRVAKANLNISVERMASEHSGPFTHLVIILCIILLSKVVSYFNNGKYITMLNTRDYH